MAVIPISGGTGEAYRPPLGRRYRAGRMEQDPSSPPDASRPPEPAGPPGAQHPIGRLWERMPGPMQFSVSFFIYFWVFWIGHVELLYQPVLRGFFYGIFWGATFAILTLLATRSERMKREQRWYAEHGGERDAH
jgi:hypothetical protein